MNMDELRKLAKSAGPAALIALPPKTILDLIETEVARLTAPRLMEPSADEVGRMAGVLKIECAKENGHDMATRCGFRGVARYVLARGARTPTDAEWRAAVDAYKDKGT